MVEQQSCMHGTAAQQYLADYPLSGLILDAQAIIRYLHLSALEKSIIRYPLSGSRGQIFSSNKRELRKCYGSFSAVVATAEFPHYY